MTTTNMRAAITGAGSGLGRALALEVAARGGKTLIADVNEEGAAETVALVERAGGEAFWMRADVRDPEQVEALSAAMEARWGGTDLLANNAGVAVTGAVGEAPLEDWRFCVDVNLMGVIHGCQAFLPKMVQRRRGAILNVASAAGLLNPPEMGPYNVTKAAVIALTETMHGELRQSGVRVAVLCPTFFRTNLMDTARGPAQHSKFAGKLMDKSRTQAPDVARAALDALDKNRLHVVPMADGRVLWSLKRAIPGLYSATSSWLAKRVTRATG